MLFTSFARPHNVLIRIKQMLLPRVIVDYSVSAIGNQVGFGTILLIEMFVRYVVAHWEERYLSSYSELGYETHKYNMDKVNVIGF